MFNRGGAFNRQAFNRQIPENLHEGKSLLVGSGVFYALPNTAIKGSATLAGAGTAIFRPTKRGAATLAGAGTATFPEPSFIYSDSKTFSGIGTFELAGFSKLITPEETFSGVGTIELGTYLYGALTLGGAGIIEPSGLKIITIPLTLAGNGEIEIIRSTKSRTSGLYFSGTIAPGAILIINTDRLFAELNGEDVSYLLAGEYFNLSPGNNYFIISDKDLEYNVIHSDRWI